MKGNYFMYRKATRVISMFSFLFLCTACRPDEVKKISDSEKKFSAEATGQYGRGAKSDGKDTNSEESATRVLTDKAETIIIYFSRSGNTENMAFMIHQETHADILEIEVKNPYPANYEKTVERANKERESEQFPMLSTSMPDFSQYHTIYIGYPIWAMTLANPMRSLLNEHGKEFSSKKIIAFSTNAGYGEGESVDKIAELIPNSRVESSLSIEDSEVMANKDTIVQWIKGIN